MVGRRASQTPANERIVTPWTGFVHAHLGEMADTLTISDAQPQDLGYMLSFPNLKSEIPGIGGVVYLPLTHAGTFVQYLHAHDEGPFKDLVHDLLRASAPETTYNGFVANEHGPELQLILHRACSAPGVTLEEIGTQIAAGRLGRRTN